MSGVKNQMCATPMEKEVPLLNELVNTSILPVTGVETNRIS